VGGAEVGGEPTLERAGDGGVDAFALYGGDTGVPALGGADFHGGVGEGEALQAIGGVDAEPLADDAAHGDAAEVDAVDGESVEKAEEVVAKGFDGGWAVA